MNGGEAVKTVGRIDRKLYSCVAPDILTDEVVITDERIEHIKERHPLVNRTPFVRQYGILSSKWGDLYAKGDTRQAIYSRFQEGSH